MKNSEDYKKLSKLLMEDEEMEEIITKNLYNLHICMEMLRFIVRNKKKILEDLIKL